MQTLQDITFDDNPETNSDFSFITSMLQIRVSEIYSAFKAESFGSYITYDPAVT